MKEAFMTQALPVKTKMTSFCVSALACLTGIICFFFCNFFHKITWSLELEFTQANSTQPDLFFFGKKPLFERNKFEIKIRIHWNTSSINNSVLEFYLPRLSISIEQVQA